MPHARSHRKNLYVDRAVQGSLVRRTLFYWFACLLFLAIPVVIAKTMANLELVLFEHLGGIWQQYWPVYLAAGLMLPFVAYDVIRVSHRFVGPLVRVRGEMKKMATDKAANHLVFRDGDYVQDLATSFSQIAKRLEAKAAEAK